MALMAWNDNMSVNIRLVDGRHKKSKGVYYKDTGITRYRLRSCRPRLF